MNKWEFERIVTRGYNQALDFAGIASLLALIR